MGPEVTPLSPFRFCLITLFNAQRGNQGVVHHLPG